MVIFFSSGKNEIIRNKKEDERGLLDSDIPTNRLIFFSDSGNTLYCPHDSDSGVVFLRRCLGKHRSEFGRLEMVRRMTFSIHSWKLE